MHSKDTISIWFFIGTLLLIYGILILGSEILGIKGSSPVVLAELRPGLWMGLLLLALGGLYTYKFRPGKG